MNYFTKIISLKSTNMKKLFLVVAVIVTSVSVNAQRSLMGSHTNFSLGIEGSAPTGLFHTNGYKVGFGGSLQIENKQSVDLGLTLNIGFLSYGNNSTNYNYHYNIIPLLAGLKYYVSPKVYLHGQLGASFATLKLPRENFTNTSFTYSPGIGFMVSQDVDFLIKYMGISNSIALFDNNGNFYYNQTANTFGMRLAYTFGK